MRYLLTILAMLIVRVAGAQSRSGHYSKIVYSAVGKGYRTETTRLKIPQGTIHVADRFIIIDSASKSRQVYSIIKRTEVEDYDWEDSSAEAGIQFFSAIEISSKGTFRVLGYLLYRDDKQHVTDLVFMPSPGREITYTFNKED